MQITSADKQLYDEGYFTLEGIQKAYIAQDPRLAEYVIKLVRLDPTPMQQGQYVHLYNEFRQNYHKDAIDRTVLQDIEPDFRPKNSNRPHQIRRRQKAQLFTNRFNDFVAAHPYAVPERLKMGEFILTLYDDDSAYAQQQLLDILAEVPMKWGPWQAFKYILKRGLIDQKWTVFATVWNRWTQKNIGINTYRNYRLSLSSNFLTNDITSNSFQYAYRFGGDINSFEITTESGIFLKGMIQKLLLRQFEVLPALVKEEVTIEVLRSATSFYWNDIWYQWATSLAWTSNGDALFDLWQNAKMTQIQEWALDQILNNHRSMLKVLAPEWIIKNALDLNTPRNVRDFITDWIIEPITEIEKSKFISHNLHQVILTFLDTTYGSLDSRKVQYACDFIRQFMDDLVSELSLNKVLWMLRHQDQQIHELGLYLLFPDGEKKSPFMEHLDLAFWTELLDEDRMYKYAIKAIQEQFSKDVITLDWLKGRLYSSKAKLCSLAQDWIRTGMHQPNLDFYQLYHDNAFGRPSSQNLYTWAWRNLEKEDETGAKLTDRFTVNDYRMLLLSDFSTNRQKAIFAFENSLIPTEYYPIDLLKHLLTDSDFQDKGWQTFIKGDFVPVSSCPSDLSKFALKTITNSTSCNLETLGYRWVLDRHNSSQDFHKFIRALFQEKFPNHLLPLLDPSASIESLNEDFQKDPVASNDFGIRYVWDLIDASLYHNGNDAKFWIGFLQNRLQRKYDIAVKSHQFSSECIVSPNHFSLDWFQTQLDKESYYHKMFALEIAQMYLSDWIVEFEKTAIFGFKALKTFLFSPISEVKDFFQQVIENPKNKYAKIDLMGPSFLPEELFEYCYSSDPEISEMGLRMIREKPEKFAQPDKLIELTTSPDPAIRALVIEVLYRIAHIPLVTSEWMPYEDSVIPNNTQATGRNRVQVSFSFPDETAVDSIKYLGSGTSINLEPNLSDYDKLVYFANRQLFRLPPKPGKRKKSKDAKATWEVKKMLMISFRDLAIQDRQFAEKMVPIFQELTKFQGIRVREQAWSALAHLEHHYAANPLSSLTAFQDVEISAPVSK